MFHLLLPLSNSEEGHGALSTLAIVFNAMDLIAKKRSGENRAKYIDEVNNMAITVNAWLFSGSSMLRKIAFSFVIFFSEHAHYLFAKFLPEGAFDNI